MEQIIEYNTVAVDWLTLTSFDPKFYAFWAQQLDQMSDEKKDVKWKQYLGQEVNITSGMVKLMSGEQNGRPHCIVWVSGSLANVLMEKAMEQVANGLCECKRIDLQVTTPYPKGWEQFRLLTQLKEVGRVGCS